MPENAIASLAHLQQRAALARLAESVEEDCTAGQEIDEVEHGGGDEMIEAEDVLKHDRAHAFEDMSRRQEPGEILESGRQHRDRIVDGARRRQQKDGEPGEAL